MLGKTITADRAEKKKEKNMKEKGKRDHNTLLHSHSCSEAHVFWLLGSLNAYQQQITAMLPIISHGRAGLATFGL